MNKQNVWDSLWWKDIFEKACFEKDDYLIHELRRDVFNDTRNHCMANGYIINGKKVSLEPPEESRVFNHRIHISAYATSPMQCGEKTRVHVLNEDCLATARRISSNGIKPLVLNMANRQNPGGGVTAGAGAQEECLFRSSNYYQTLYKVKDKYPLDRNWGAVIFPDVTVFRGLEEEGYPLLEDPFKCDFVAVPAINHPTLNEAGKMLPEMVEGTHKKIKMILDSAIVLSNYTLVLSAFGCGAFKNPPEQIAEIFKEELKYYDHTFNNVYFSIKPDHNDKLNKNFRAFEEFFKDW